MTLNWWTLGLQAVNVLILIWLLSRLFWQPLAAAISARQSASSAMLEDAKTAKDKAETALTEVTEIRAGMAAERTEMLADAAKQAQAATKLKMTEAAQKAATLIEAAERKFAQETEVAQAKSAQDSVALAVEIAQKLLARLEIDTVQDRFLALLLTAITSMTPEQKATLISSKDGLKLLSATALKATTRAQIEKAVAKALGAKPVLKFVTQPDLIAGFELRTSHIVLHNSWQADLADILKGMKNAA